MDIASVKRMFKIIDTVYGNADILDDSLFPYKWVLSEAVRNAESSWRLHEHDSLSYPSWGYQISAELPLSFKSSEVLNGVRVDIYCDVKWTKLEDNPSDYILSKQDVKLRIWSEDDNIVFRPQLDSNTVFERLTDSTRSRKGRVISRFHFDKTDHSQGKSNEYHPEYHLQVGGISTDDELCWHPPTFDIPRIAHPPMELFLICQLVANNFFPSKYVEITKEIPWQEQLHTWQNKMLLEYYEKCLRALRDKSSLMDFLRSS